MFDSIKRVLPSSLKQVLRTLVYTRHLTLPSAPRSFIFLGADYGNIGDLAITAAQQRFLAQTLPEHRVVTVPISATREVIRSIRQQVAPSDLITTIGGGNMGSTYPDIEELRQLVIQSFPDNRVICFPQTLDWADTTDSGLASERIKRVYSKHPNLYLFARESVTFDILQTLFAEHRTVKVGLVPDIVLSATAEELGARSCAGPAGALLCLRDDNERSLDDNAQAKLKHAVISAGFEVEITDTHAGGSRLAPELCAELLADKLSQFRAAELVVTDRLHGMILSVLAGTPCLVLPNSNHKIKQTWINWLQDNPLVAFVEPDRFGDLPDAIESLVSTKRGGSSAPPLSAALYLKLNNALTLQVDTP